MQWPSTQEERYNLTNELEQSRNGMGYVIRGDPEHFLKVIFGAYLECLDAEAVLDI